MHATGNTKQIPSRLTWYWGLISFKKKCRLIKLNGQLHVPDTLCLKRCVLYGSRLQAVTKSEFCAYRKYLQGGKDLLPDVIGRDW